MVQINPSSIRDLRMLASKGIPVTLTSHPGNASLYKLVLWRCGIPEHLWDVTCCVADANNWPMFRLKGGEATLLVTEERYEEIVRATSPARRYVTAYQRTTEGGRLGRSHVRAVEASYPDALSSCSRLILSEEKRMREVFGFLAETRPEVFGRYIAPEGVMVPLRESGIRRGDVVDSFFSLLRELDHLLFSDAPIETKGGACYDGVMVPLATMLAQYWQTGYTERYDISGPDMIHYATRPGHQKALGDMLQHLHAWNPALVPAHITVRMLPGTGARVGYLGGHASESVMRRKTYALSYLQRLSSPQKRLVWQEAENDERVWPVDIQPSKEKYFSQYDLQESDGLSVDDFWQEVPLEDMRALLVRANALLRLK